MRRQLASADNDVFYGQAEEMRPQRLSRPRMT